MATRAKKTTPSSKHPRDAAREGETSRSPQEAELVIITGLSGSGKGSALKVFEDVGYYAVDNLPIELLPTFADLCGRSPEIARAALVIDIREGAGLKRLPQLLEDLQQNHRVFLLFLEAGDEVLQRRFSETRRPHPMGTTKTVRENIRRERKTLLPIRALADLTIDTSQFNIHDLRRLIQSHIHGPAEKPILLLRVTSFGFKFGIPIDSDLVFDVRFLPNPNYRPDCKHLSGKDPKVIRYIRSFAQTGEFIGRISDLLVFLIPHYLREGKSYLTISFGCTGGRHRSVMISEAIARNLAASGHTAKVSHRDIHREE